MDNDISSKEKKGSYNGLKIIILNGMKNLPNKKLQVCTYICLYKSATLKFTNRNIPIVMLKIQISEMLT